MLPAPVRLLLQHCMTNCSPVLPCCTLCCCCALQDMSYSRIKSLVNEELKSYFRPEFLNRLDEIIVFRQLTKKEVKQIADIMLRDVFKRGEEKGLKIEVTEKFKDRWVLEGKGLKGKAQGRVWLAGCAETATRQQSTGLRVVEHR